MWFIGAAPFLKLGESVSKTTNACFIQPEECLYFKIGSVDIQIFKSLPFPLDKTLGTSQMRKRDCQSKRYPRVLSFRLCQVCGALNTDASRRLYCIYFLESTCRCKCKLQRRITLEISLWLLKYRFKWHREN